MKKNPAFHIKDLVVFFKEAKNYFMSREILLAMDFSTRFRSLALWDMNANCLLDCAIMDIDYNNQPSGAISVNQEQGGICAVINNILIKNGLEDNSVSVLSLGIGPGSYTGIRTSISFAQGWSLALGIHLLPINSVEALALQAGKLFSNNEFHLVVDAQRNEFYHAVYRKNNDEKNVIVEIRGGAGGEEAALFAGSLYRMYNMYSESKRWNAEVISANETELGGYKEIVFMIEGAGAYSKLKYESGVHRVQRVPDTETQGRIHTSTVTVAVLPEAEDVELEINPADLKIDTFRSSGAGGQHINKTSSAIRVTHIPTGTVVECQDERSQFKNKDKALKILRSRLLDAAQREHDEAIASDRKSQVGTGDRSERIRTYNYPQGRVTDHRIGLTLYKLEQVLDGDLDEIIDALTTYYRTEALKAENEAQG